MGKIVYLMGKSSSGKDTVFKELMKEGTMDLRIYEVIRQSDKDTLHEVVTKILQFC